MAIVTPAKFVPTTELALLVQVVEGAEAGAVVEEEEEVVVAVPTPAVPPERKTVMSAGACRWEVSAALPAKGGIAM